MDTAILHASFSTCAKLHGNKGSEEEAMYG